ncbi:unnamed protein product [Mucor hiemalis]
MQQQLQQLREEHRGELNSLRTSHEDVQGLRQQVLDLTNQVETLQIINFVPHYQESFEKQRLAQEETARAVAIMDDRATQIRRLEGEKALLEQSVLELRTQQSNMDSGSKATHIIENTDNEESHGGSIDEEGWESNSITESQIVLAQELRQKQSSIHVNSGRVRPETDSGYSKHKYPCKSFDGTGKPTAFDWMDHFKQIVEYHEWSPSHQIKEFRMAMTGNTTSIDSLMEAFTATYGGEDERFAYSLSILETIKQGKEPMLTFGPRLQDLIMNICPTNFKMQMNYLKRAVHPKLFLLITGSKPATLKDAIHGYSTYPTLAPTNDAPVWNSMPLPVGDDPMDVDAQQNAQRYQHRYKQGNSVNKHDKKSKDSANGDSSKKMTKSCFDCKYVNQAKALKNKKQNSYRNNAQQVKNTEEKPKKITTTDNNDIDFNKNLFHQLAGYSNNSQYLPSIIQQFNGGEANPDRSFVMTGTVEEQDVELLVDTGAQISSISMEAVTALELPLVDATPISILYGNNSSGTSTYC